MLELRTYRARLPPCDGQEITSISKTWYVSCSPRNPEKIAPELRLFEQIQGENWDKKVNGKLVTQIQFAKMLETCPTFEGSISSKDPSFSSRDRVKPYKTFGFAYIDKKDRVVITDAGRRLVAGIRPKEVFLRQLLKWQYPSYQHRGKKYEIKDSNLMEYIGGEPEESKDFYTMPFVDTLDVIRRIGGVSKREIAMFLLPKIRMGNVKPTIESIRENRERLEEIRGRVPKKRFVNEQHFKIYAKLYADQVRRMDASEAKSEIWKKVRNSLDVSDATIRHFRYTGILTVIGSLLSVTEDRMKDVDSILSMGLKPVNFHDDVDQFYRYIGNPDLPVLEYEHVTILSNRVLETYNHLSELKKRYPLVQLPVIPQTLSKLSVPKLKDLLDHLEIAKLEIGKQALEEQLRYLNKAEIVTMFQRIVDGDDEVFDPPVYFEWNTYRALVAMDHAKVIPNFEMDEAFQPVGHAPGGKPDIIAEFQDYMVITEVTLQTGRRQYMVENEPVVDHVGMYQKSETGKSNPRPVYGLFVAPKIVTNTVNYFYISAQTNTPEYGGPVKVVPLDLAQFLQILEFAGRLGSLQPQELKSLFSNFCLAREKSGDPSQWKESIDIELRRWMDYVATHHQNN